MAARRRKPAGWFNHPASHDRSRRITAHEYRRRCLTVRVALGLGALAAVAGLLGFTTSIVSGTSRAGDGTVAVGAQRELAAAIAVGGVLAGAAAVTRALWPHLLGLLGTTAVSLAAAGAVIGARSSERLVAESAPSLDVGGVLLIGAFLVATSALGMHLRALRTLSRRFDEEDSTRPEAGVAAKANAALVTGSLSLLLPPLAGLAVALGLLAQGDIRRSHNQLEGAGRAFAGTVLGSLVLILIIVAGVVGVALVRPTP
jgi:hypothetical protein